MVTSLLKAGDGTAHYFVVIILLLLVILAMVAWNWALTLPGLLKSAVGWAAFILTLLLVTELLPWKKYAIAGQQIGLEAFKWMDARPMFILLVLPALLVGSLLWSNPA